MLAIARRATFADDQATGEVEIYPQAPSFTAEAASGDAGLYRAIKDKVGEVGTGEAGSTSSTMAARGSKMNKDELIAARALVDE